MPGASSQPQPPEVIHEAVTVRPARKVATIAEKTPLSFLTDINFHVFVTPQLVRVIYVLAFALAALAIVSAFFSGYKSTFDSTNPNTAHFWSRMSSGFVSCLYSVVASAIMILLVRVALEATMVFFRMCEFLERIAEREDRE